MPEFERGLLEYCIEQEQENVPFISKISWKDQIKRIQFLKLFLYLFNDGNGLHTFLRDSTALVGVGLLIVEMSRLHSDTLRKVGTLWTRDRPVAETPALQHTQNPNKRQIFILPSFETAIPVNKRPQTRIFDRVATGISGLNTREEIFRPVPLQPVNGS